MGIRLREKSRGGRERRAGGGCRRGRGWATGRCWRCPAMPAMPRVSLVPALRRKLSDPVGVPSSLAWRSLRGVQGAPCAAAGQTAASQSAWQDSSSGVRMWRNAGDGPAHQTSQRGAQGCRAPPHAPLLALLARLSEARPRPQAVKVRQEMSSVCLQRPRIPPPSTRRPGQERAFLFVLPSGCFSEGRGGPAYSLSSVVGFDTTGNSPESRGPRLNFQQVEVGSGVRRQPRIVI